MQDKRKRSPNRPSEPPSPRTAPGSVRFRLRPVGGDQSEREALPHMSLEVTDGVSLARPGGAGFPDGGRVQESNGSDSSLKASAWKLVTALLVEVRDDLGFDTVSLYVRGPADWRLLERRGPERAWHGVLDPSMFEGTSEAVEYPDVRAIPGVGPRLAGLGCSSVAMLPLPDGARVMCDGEDLRRAGGWKIGRAHV